MTYARHLNLRVLGLLALAAPLLLGAGRAAADVRADFNGDGRDDLAIGVPNEDLPDGVGGTLGNAGAVNVIYGTARGLRARGDQFWHQDSPGVKDAAESGDRFGFALAAGDFDGDGFDDLAIGVIGEDLPDGAGGTLGFAGAVNVLYGTARGLRARGDQFWHQDSPGVNDAAESGDRFGNALAAGDFDGDGFDDLAIGVPFEDLPDGAGGTLGFAGAVNVLYGTARGLRARGDQFWHQDSPGVKDAAEAGDEFGFALAAGDFDNNGKDDLAIGVQREGLPDGAGGTLGNAGAVNVLYGTARGLRARGDQFWHQDSPGVKDAAEAGDLFSEALAVGDFDNNGKDDLAIGVLLEDLPDGAGGTLVNAGAVNVIYGSRTGLRARGDQFWHQDSPGVNDAAEVGDQFGTALAAGDFDNNGKDDLAIGVLGEDLPDGAGGSIVDAGAVNVLYGSRTGLRARGDQFWHQDSPGVNDAAEASDLFGNALTAGDFDNNGKDDLAIGVVREGLPDGAGGTLLDAGAVNVLYGSRTGLRARGDQFWHQDSPGVKDAAEGSEGFGTALP